MKVYIRSESLRDYAQIKQVNNLAFGRLGEGLLIEKLRLNSEFVEQLSLVAELDEAVVGHILFFPIKVNDGIKQHTSLALAPMAVLPEFQKQRIGGQLITNGLHAARQFGFKSVIVLGHPEYYPKFGFRPARQWNIRTHYKVPDEVFMAIELIDGGLKGVSGMVEYPKEFEEAG